MGRDKALLEFAGETLIERALGKLRDVGHDVAIAGGTPDLARFARLVPDGYAGFGPLGGIVSALEQSASTWNLFLPVDLPGLPIAALRGLLSLAQPQAVNVYRDRGGTEPGRVHPLCCLIARASLPTLRHELEHGNLRVRLAFEAAGPIQYMETQHTKWFVNVNTPEDFHAFEQASLAPRGQDAG
jgi:molybdopterin-guanine dinucleotide biosynthesis protein A